MLGTQKSFKRKLREAVMQVEEVPVLAPLQQGAQLGGEQFLPRKGQDVGGATEPGILDTEGYRDDRVVRLDLVGIDFDLEPQGSEFVADDLVYPVPQGAAGDNYVFYIGFDPQALGPETKKAKKKK